MKKVLLKLKPFSHPILFYRFLRGEVVKSFLRLEASSLCQLKCPVCATGKGFNKKSVIGEGYLKFNDFKRLIDDNPWIKKIELSNYGEIFLNPEIKEIIEYAFLKKVKLTASNGVNLNYAEEPVLEAMVKNRFHFLSVSIDGATQETYEIYRRGGNLEKVLRNIEKINAYKERYRSPFPKLRWSFIVFGHNEHEIARARELARKLNMAFRLKLNHTPAYSPVQNEQMLKKEKHVRSASREEYKKVFGNFYQLPCAQLWKEPQVNWDGKLLGCCKNKYGDFGNVFEDGLKNTLYGERFLYAKRMLMGLAPPREDIPCLACSIYRKAKLRPSLWQIFDRVVE